jgi:hypothetical protein
LKPFAASKEVNSVGEVEYFSLFFYFYLAHLPCGMQVGCKRHAWLL